MGLGLLTVRNLLRHLKALNSLGYTPPPELLLGSLNSVVVESVLLAAFLVVHSLHSSQD